MKTKGTKKSLVFGALTDAQYALDYMTDEISRKGHITINRLFMALDGTSDGTKEFGWTNVSNAYIKKMNGGYGLILPKPEKLSAPD